MTQEKAAAEAEERERQEEELREQRKNDSKEIAGETIRRELQESASLLILPTLLLFVTAIVGRYVVMWCRHATQTRTDSSGIPN